MCISLWKCRRGNSNHTLIQIHRVPQTNSTQQPKRFFTYGLGLLMRMLHAWVKIDCLNYGRLYLILIISLRRQDAYDHKPITMRQKTQTQRYNRLTVSNLDWTHTPTFSSNHRWLTLNSCLVQEAIELKIAVAWSEILREPLQKKRR